MTKLRTYPVVLCSLLSFSSMAVIDVNVAINEHHNTRAPYVRGELLVRVNPAESTDTFNQLALDAGAKSLHSYSMVPGLRLYQFDPDRDVNEVIRAFASDRAVLYAEPNYLYRVMDDENSYVNDPEYAQQWALENLGQTGGLVDADVNAEAMWALQRGNSNIVIGIIDTGIDTNHPDLVANIWVNSGEIRGNGIDDDRNGYIDDINGINAIRNNGNPLDDNVHGTHVAGTIGASGNNGLGVVGIAQSVKMIGCKFLSSGGSGSAADAIKCLEYFSALKSRAQNPVNLVATNNSWGGGGSSRAMLDAIKVHERQGILFLAAAGNDGSNNDFVDSFPANYEVSNIISVAATDASDRLASFSNYGKSKVHIAAPGVNILSTTLNGKYGQLSGTSMATPHVTGLAAIIASHYPNATPENIRNLIIAGGQKIEATRNTTISGRRMRGADKNGIGSLTCLNQELVARKTPANTTHRLELGDSLFLSAININCSTNGGPLTLYSGALGSVVLDDHGQNGDVIADDGIFSLNWQPMKAGEYQLRFKDGDVVVVTVIDSSNLNPYVANDRIPYSYTTIGGRRVGAGDDTMHEITAPFPIRFAGHEGYTQLFASSNGTISFTNPTSAGFINRNIPTTAADTLIAAYWDDLTTAAQEADIYYETIGTSPSRKFIVEWWHLKHVQSLGVGSFQVVFYENSPNFAINYLDTNFSTTAISLGRSATVGVQVSSSLGLQYSYNTASIPSNKSILFTLNQKQE